jgi:hypothetical protein
MKRAPRQTDSSSITGVAVAFVLSTALCLCSLKAADDAGGPAVNASGQGSELNPIKGRRNSEGDRLLESFTQSFAALTVGAQTEQTRDDVRRRLTEDVEVKRLEEVLPKCYLYEKNDGTIMFDPSARNAPDVKKVAYYIVEEDRPLNELDLAFYVAQSRVVQELNQILLKRKAVLGTSLTSTPVDSTLSFQPMLRVMTEDGQLVRWVPGSTVTFSILKWTFNGDEARYQMVRRNCQLAAAAWENTCNVRLQYRAEYDNAPRGSAYPVDGDGKKAVTFVAMQYPLGGAIARSFFPNDSVTHFQLVVDPEQYFTTTVDRVGVIRHELGHVLGFRHEHISPDAPVWTSTFCSSESAQNSTAVTAYDRASVMHYPCSTSTSGPIPANLKLEITNLDRIGARAVYGAPGGSPPNGPQFRNFDPSPN